METKPLTRYEVRLYAPEGAWAQDINTFTWGSSYDAAYARIAEQFDRDNLWEGWSFAIVPEDPTPFECGNDGGPQDI